MSIAGKIRQVYAAAHLPHVENVAQVAREGHDPRDPEGAPDSKGEPAPQSQPVSSARPTTDVVRLSAKAQAAFEAAQIASAESAARAPDDDEG